MDFAEALKLAKAGRAILFLGAGFSFGTKNSNGGTMKTGQGFSDYLALKVGLPSGTGLMDTAEAFLEQYGPDTLINELVKEFDASELLPHQIALAKIPWKQIYSTNYDNIVEKAFKSLKLPLITVNPDVTVAGIAKGKSVCIHLNGSIIDITPEKLQSQIKLTDTSYLTSSIADSEWGVRLRQDIDAAQAVFYVGYSTYDLDIARVLFAKSGLKDKSFFIVGSNPSPLLLRRIDKFGSNPGLSAAEFAEEIAKDKYTPDSSLSPAEYCLRTYAPSEAIAGLTDADVFDLFRLGRLSESHVFQSASQSQPYVAMRRAVESATAIVQKQPSAVVLHSGLGNGKTVLLEMLKATAYISGFTVISFVRQGNQLFEELELSLRRPGRLLFIVDNYGNWLDALKFIGTHHKKNVSVILAARTTTHDLLAGRVESLLALGEVREIILDRMHPLDLVNVANLIDTYGLWGTRAGWSQERKEKYLSADCSGAWHAILLSLFKAPQIKDRLDKLIADIKGEVVFNRILITIMVLAIVDYPATIDNLVDLCGDRVLSIGFRQNVTIRELIDFETDEVKLKSSVTGAFLLKSVADPETTLESLIFIAKAADYAARASREYFAILVSLVRFGNAQNFFPEDDRGRAVIRYYEAIKELQHCKRNPLFWLQYAIACLFLKDFERSGIYFQTAYSFAEESNFRPYQIDNHYARFLLLKSIHDDNISSAMAAFRKARKIIYEQIRNERLHYPYRVAALVGDWYETYSHRLAEDARMEVRRAAQSICATIATLPDARQKQRHVVECFKKLDAIVQEK
jgi:hypothetical protein